MGRRGARRGGVLAPDLRLELASAAARLDTGDVTTREEPSVAERHEAVDVASLNAVGSDITAALLVDLRRVRDGH